MGKRVRKIRGDVTWAHAKSIRQFLDSDQARENKCETCIRNEIPPCPKCKLPEKYKETVAATRCRYQLKQRDPNSI